MFRLPTACGCVIPHAIRRTLAPPHLCSMNATTSDKPSETRFLWEGPSCDVDRNGQPMSASIRKVFQGNEKWVRDSLQHDPRFFAKLAETQQKPEFLFLGCSDSRAPANALTGLSPGEMFVHRNVANIVVGTDLNFLSVLQYSVEVLRVNHILVVGHYGCGGVLAAMESRDNGLVENWLRNIRDVARLHVDELDQISDRNLKYRRLVELNVQEQCINILKTGIVQRRFTEQKGVGIHGMVYDIADGKLRELAIDFKGYVNKYSHLYRLHAENSPRS
eukprot:gnl/Spiro4/24179_TR11998_c0_g1_i1.p1 gnl/Spiro4/24179_TR11998_c0_g1~~gnl/Spiro4/24179_TR11998_c0_g1_i1.p1  ORF type:complete len:291 (+),score=56.24 gnl/Spiro4/24179_TR11998_c0_g1_i1:47-874(+)